MEATPPPPPPPRPPTPREWLARLRSRLPVSPLPWHWSRRLRRAALVLLVLVVGGAALASVLLQDDPSTPAREQAPTNLAPRVQSLLDGMSPAEKADAVLIAGFSDSERALRELRKAQLGGVLLTEETWPGAGSGQELSSQLRSAGSRGGRIPPLIVARQEGGGYRSLTDLSPAETELEIGETGEPSRAEAWALETGEALSGEGIDLNLAPVADVATLDSPIADRAFGDDPALVTQMTTAAVRGCAKGGVACAVSHFPGLGGATEDTALGPSTVGLDAASLERRDLPPFEAAFAARAPAVVLSLALYAAYDPVTPGALSPAIADELLREQLAFKGVAITDDLSSGAIAAGTGAAEAGPTALAAGADMVLVSDPAEARATRKTLAEAVASGAVSSGRIDQAVARVLELKRGLGLLPAPKQEAKQASEPKQKPKRAGAGGKRGRPEPKKR